MKILILIFFLLLVHCRVEKIQLIHVHKDKHNQYQVIFCPTDDFRKQITNYQIFLSYRQKGQKIQKCQKPYRIKNPEQKCFSLNISSCPNSMNPEKGDIDFVDSFTLIALKMLTIRFFEPSSQKAFQKEIHF